MLDKMTKEEMETLSFADLTEMILKEEKKSLNTPTIFKKICSLLELSDEDYTSKIGDFYTSLTTDKRFILLEDACWDLRDNHSIDIVIEEDEDEEELEEDEEEDSTQDEENDEIDDLESLDDESLDDSDDLEDLNIISEDEEIDE